MSENAKHNKSIALVTGANKGIGLQIAKDLVANGLTVLIGSRDLARGEEAARSIGDGAVAIQLDVTDSASIASAAERILNEFGRLDVLVNNAGISHVAKPGESREDVFAGIKPSIASMDEVRAVFETNVFGVIAVTQAMIPLLRESSAPRIVNVSSTVGSLTLTSDPNYAYRAVLGAAYSPSKAALNAVTISFAAELESEGIRVNSVCPGYTATDLNSFSGHRTVEEGAREPVRLALLENGPTATFTNDEGPLPW